jgi:hypothetical protein
MLGHSYEVQEKKTRKTSKKSSCGFFSSSEAVFFLISVQTQFNFDIITIPI